jgi:nitrogen-specific signal transduction histidine kinase/CheY-like chemotaxis protein
VCGITTDITERRRLEEQLQRSQKMEALGRLASGVAHDFNNVLTAILGNAELLQSSGLDESELEYTNDIKKAVQLASSLTRQLLAFSRRQVRELRVVDLNEVVTGIEGLLRHVSAEGVKLSLACAPTPVRVKADVSQLEQVLLNLVINAHDAMPGGGTVTVTTKVVKLDEEAAVKLGVAKPGEYSSLEVRDTGIGITPGVKARLFEPFFSTKAGKGTGLGLATVYGITQQSGGHVLVDSEPGAGALFTVLLPHEVSPVPKREPVRIMKYPAVKGACVLVVDDDSAVRRVLARVLRDAGYEVLSAGDGLEALQVESEHTGQIHVLVTDVLMPGMLGPELAQRFTARRPNVRLILMSGNAADALTHVGELPAGAQFLAKPLSVEQLTQTVRQLLTEK